MELDNVTPKPSKAMEKAKRALEKERARVFKFELELSSEQIMYLFVGAFEGATTYWCQSAFKAPGNKWKRPTAAEVKEHARDPWYARPSFYETDFRINFEYDAEEGEEGNGKGRMTVGPDEVRAGLKAMSKTPDGAQALGEIFGENADAGTYDTFLQYVIFGKAVYG